MRSSGTKADSATLHSRALRSFDALWASLPDRLALIPGKDVLSDLRALIAQEYGVSIPDSKIVLSMHEEDVPPDFIELLRKLEDFRVRPAGG